MCGLAILNFNEINNNFISFDAMLNIIKHRGPDDDGWVAIKNKKKYVG